MSQDSQNSLVMDTDDEHPQIRSKGKLINSHKLPSNELLTDEVNLRMEVIQSLTEPCDRHKLRLLSKCPVCEKPFPIPALWVEGHCRRCFTSFAEMAKYQKHY